MEKMRQTAPNESEPIANPEENTELTGWEAVAAMAGEYGKTSINEEDAETEKFTPTVNIEEILGRTLPSSFLDEENPETPQLSELKIVGPTSPPVLRREAARLKVVIGSNPEYEMDRSEMSRLAEYFDNPQIPPEEKSDMLNYVGESFRNFYFDQFFDAFADGVVQKGKKDDPFAFDEPAMNFEVPFRINGVPAPKDIKKPSLGQLKDFLTTDQLSDAQKSDAGLLLMAQYVTSSEEYFKSPLITQNVAKRLEELGRSSSAIERFKEQWAAEYDARRLETIKASIDREKNTSINPRLKELLLEHMPEDYSDLEKSIYAYLKLCDTLSYDGIYYMDDKKQGVHLNSARVGDVDSDNNKVVCYEFAHIFESMLSDFGIDYKKHHNINEDGSFTNGHSNSTYLIGDMILFADSTRSVEEGDMVKVKLLERTNGIRCENYTASQQEIFSRAYEKVKAQIDGESERVAYADIVKKYDEINKRHYLTIADKFNFMFSELNQTDLTGIDLFSAEHLLETHIFESMEGLKKALIVDGDDMAIQFALTTKQKNPRDATIAVFTYDLNSRELKKKYAKEPLFTEQDESSSVFDSPDVFN